MLLKMRADSSPICQRRIEFALGKGKIGNEGLHNKTRGTHSPKEKNLRVPLVEDQE